MALADDDGRWYMYQGCSPGNPLTVVELDPHNGFAEVGVRQDGVIPVWRTRGWEVPGDSNNQTYDLSKSPSPSSTSHRKCGP